MDAISKDEFPPELADSFKSFSLAIDEIEKAMQPLQDTPKNEMMKKFTPLEVAKLDLVCAYSINSIFWMHLITRGVNPKSHDIKGELDRIKSYMGKVREIEDRKNAPKLKKDAAKRFVRNAMFDVEEKNQQKRDEDHASQQDSSTCKAQPSKTDLKVVKAESDQVQCDEADSSTKSVPTGTKRKHKKTDKSRKQSKKARSKS